MRIVLSLLFLMSCATEPVKTRRSPSSLFKETCGYQLRYFLEGEREFTLAYKSLWNKVFGGQRKAKYSFARYNETKKHLITLPLKSLKTDSIDYGEKLEFEDLVAYFDVVALKMFQSSSLEKESYHELSHTLEHLNKKSRKILVDIKRKFDRDEVLTETEIESLASRYLLASYGAPPSALKNPSEAFKRAVWESFFKKVTTDSLSKMFQKEGFKNPAQHQIFIDHVIKLMRSRIVKMTRNIVLPILQAKSGIIPLPLREVDFIIDDETVELILKRGLQDAWLDIEQKYRRMGITHLRFNEIVKYYRPIGAVGFFATAYLYMEAHNKKILEERTQEVEKMLVDQLDAAESAARNIIAEAKTPLLQEALNEFEEVYGRPPNEKEKLELELLFN